VEARRDRVNDAVRAVAAESASTSVVRRSAFLRGASTLTTFGLEVEIVHVHARRVPIAAA